MAFCVVAGSKPVPAPVRSRKRIIASSSFRCLEAHRNSPGDRLSASVYQASVLPLLDDCPAPRRSSMLLSASLCAVWLST